ncbi:uncharacterized protein BCR38DRAFT_311094, partial [Pseudomassariella vexata]
QPLVETVGPVQLVYEVTLWVKNKSSELFERGIAELDKEDLPALDSHERCLVEDMRSMGVPEDVDWSSFGLG